MDRSADARVLLAYAAFVGALVLFFFMRYGLLTGVVFGYVWGIGPGMLTLDTSAWYFGRSLLIAGVIAALALYGAVVSTGNKPLLADA